MKKKIETKYLFYTARIKPEGVFHPPFSKSTNIAKQGHFLSKIGN